MATRVNAHEERLATLNSIMNVIAILDMDAPRRSASDRWIDVRALMPAVEIDADEDSWINFAASHMPVGQRESTQSEMPGLEATVSLPAPRSIDY